MARGLVTGAAGSLRVARLAPFPQTGVPLTCPGAMPPRRTVGNGLPTYR